MPQEQRKRLKNNNNFKSIESYRKYIDDENVNHKMFASICGVPKANAANGNSLSERTNSVQRNTLKYTDGTRCRTIKQTRSGSSGKISII